MIPNHDPDAQDNSDDSSWRLLGWMIVIFIAVIVTLVIILLPYALNL